MYLLCWHYVEVSGQPCASTTLLPQWHYGRTIH